MERRTTSQPRKCLHCKEKYTIWLNLMRKHYNERGRPAKPPSRRKGRHWDLLIKFTLAATVPQKCVEWHLPAKVKLKIGSPWQAIRNRVRSTPSSLPKWIGGSPRACNIPRYFSVWRRTLSRANVAIIGCPFWLFVSCVKKICVPSHCYGSKDRFTGTIGA